MEWADLGLIDYESALLLQVRLSKNLKTRDLTGYLFFCEHPPTITLGYSLKGDEGKSELMVSEEYLKEKGIELVHTDRGGKATFHGPGQLIAYPVFNLNQLRLSSKKYVNKLEDVAISWLKSMGVAAGRDWAYPGVWVGDQKIGSVGVRIEDRVSRHGIAINLWPDLKYFDLIVPCGVKERKMTSYLELTGRKLELQEAVPGLLAEFAKIFQLEYRAFEQTIPLSQGGLDDDQRMADAGCV